MVPSCLIPSTAHFLSSEAVSIVMFTPYGIFSQFHLPTNDEVPAYYQVLQFQSACFVFLYVCGHSIWHFLYTNTF